MTNWAQRRRRLYNVVFFFSLRVILLTAQVMLLAPIIRSKQRGAYRTHAALTCFALLVLLLLCGVTPFLLRIIASTYERVSVQFDAIFLLIAMTSQVSDISIVLITMLSQLCQRWRLCEFLNQLQDTVQRVRAIHGRNFINAQVLLLLWLQLGLSLYDMLMQLVFLAKLAFQIAPWQIVVNLMSLYLQQCRATLQLLIMGCVLLLIACYAQLAECLEHYSEDSGADLTNYEDLVSLQNVLYKLTLQLKCVFQLPLFLLVAGEFINVLANLYAQLYYFVTTKAWWFAFVFYCAKISVELYLLIHVVHLCCVLHGKVNNLFLDRDVYFEEPTTAVNIRCLKCK